MLCTTFLLSLLPLLASASPTTPLTPELARKSAEAPVLSAAICGSVHPSWLLSFINTESYYTYQSPSASGAHFGEFGFYFYNNQVDGAVQCRGYSNLAFGAFSGAEIFACGEVNENGLGTSFSYDSSTYVVSVNSTWTCPDSDVVYTTTGEVKLDLDCDVNVNVNPNWEAEGWFSNTTTTCDPTWAVITI